MGVVAAVAAVVGAVGGIANAHTQQNAQDFAQRKATGEAKVNADLQEKALNKQNQKSPDSNVLRSANEMAAKNGPSGTMLTGTSGVDPSALQLGKQTLLGG